MKFFKILEEILVEKRIQKRLPPPKKVGFSGVKVIDEILDIYDVDTAEKRGYYYFGRGWQKKGDDPKTGLIFTNNIKTGGQGHPPNTQNQFYWGLYNKDGKLHLSAKTKDVEDWLRTNAKYIAQLLFYGEN